MNRDFTALMLAGMVAAVSRSIRLLASGWKPCGTVIPGSGRRYRTARAQPEETRRLLPSEETVARYAEGRATEEEVKSLLAWTLLSDDFRVQMEDLDAFCREMEDYDWEALAREPMADQPEKPSIQERVMPGVERAATGNRMGWREWLFGPRRVRLQLAGGVAGLCTLFALAGFLTGRAGPGLQIAGEGQGPRLVLRDGDTDILADAKGGLYTRRPLAPEVRTALEAGRLSLPAERLARLEVSKEVLRGEGSDSVTLLAPVATLVREDRPTFRWQTVPGAVGYRVAGMSDGSTEVSDIDSGAVPLRGTEWVPTESLKPGRVYQWQVTVLLPEGQSVTSGWTRFQVLTAERARLLRTEEQAARGSHLARGLLYAREGLLDEAERELQALQKANPEAEKVKLLLRQLKEARPVATP